MVLQADKAFPDKVAEILSSGSVAIMPCDTIYGIVGVAPDSDQDIKDIKGRGEDKPFLMLIRKNWIERFTDSRIEDYFLDMWPGPLTLILKSKSGGTLAVRVPDDKFLQNILNKLGKPLYSTSVNRTGRESLWRINDIVEEFNKDVPLIIDAGDMEGGVPSTIVDISSFPYKLVREGACSIDSERLNQLSEGNS